MPEQHPDFAAAVEVGQELAQEKRDAFKASRSQVQFGEQRPRGTDEWRRLMDTDERFRAEQLRKFKQESGDGEGIQDLLKRWKGDQDANR